MRKEMKEMQDRKYVILVICAVALGGCLEPNPNYMPLCGEAYGIDVVGAQAFAEDSVFGTTICADGTSGDDCEPIHVETCVSEAKSLELANDQESLS
ncbi:hypothetical protein G6O69_25670 [Pseudenhygromyxa sp. WMMC2535]|uniref:hypothetical protein n=1 Tax=Pseudenhygromyxa sp. WMMC2535 TaxID=2712867 RepID=UPI0015962B2E|nr:hypothetical protein [Pseudenhygromyxa sp. WMMC2535]NVB41254.1 hypothetical protein [Pseudenhygromyxa sp. WMMC2535]